MFGMVQCILIAAYALPSGFRQGWGSLGGQRSIYFLSGLKLEIIFGLKLFYVISNIFTSKSESFQQAKTK